MLLSYGYAHTPATDVEIPGEKRIDIALRSIYGIGPRKSQEILEAAKILENNQTLMRLRELEVLEKVAEKATLNVVLGEQGLADRMMKLL